MSNPIEQTKKLAESNLRQEIAKQIGEIIQVAVGSTADVVRELLHASMSSPLIACITGLVIADLLQKASVLYASTAQAIRLMIFAAAGLSLATETIDLLRGIESLIPFTNVPNATNSADLLHNTVVIDATSQSPSEPQKALPQDQIQKLLPLLQTLMAAAA